jgi:hypothetical protein
MFSIVMQGVSAEIAKVWFRVLGKGENREVSVLPVAAFVE